MAIKVIGLFRILFFAYLVVGFLQGTPGYAAPDVRILHGPKNSFSVEGEPYSLELGESHDGDFYYFGQKVTIRGEQNGDLLSLSQRLSVAGEVRGDLFSVAEEIDLDGVIGDSVRVAGETIRLTGTIDGDLIAFGAKVFLYAGARVTGNLYMACGEAIIEGDIDGDVIAAGGAISLKGSIGGDTKLKVDRVTIDPEARIGGDLSYTSRNRLDLEGAGIVDGEVRFKEKPKKEEEKGFSIYSVIKSAWFMAAALVAGLVFMTIFRRAVPSILDSVGKETLLSTGVGFAAVIVLPVAAAVSAILVITIPLSLSALLLYVVVIYLAKLPVAAWLGRKLLRLLGRTNPSPLWGLALGVVVLYLVFLIPYLGTLAWFGSLFLGLGALILGTRTYIAGQRSAAPAS